MALPVADDHHADTALGADDSAYNVNFEGMDFVAPSSDETIQVSVEGLEDYSYTVKADVGRINGSTSSLSGSTEDGKFSFRYTSTTALGTNTITVTIKSSEIDDGELTATYKIKVMDVYTISVNVKNTGGMALEGVPISLYVDGNLYRTNNFDIPLSTEDEETTTLSFNVDPSDFSSGTHNYEIIADNNADGLILFGDSSNLSATGTFYTGDGGWGLLSIVLTIIAVVMVVILLYTYFRRGKKKHKK